MKLSELIKFYSPWNHQKTERVYTVLIKKEKYMNTVKHEKKINIENNKIIIE